MKFRLKRANLVEFKLSVFESRRISFLKIFLVYFFALSSFISCQIWTPSDKTLLVLSCHDSNAIFLCSADEPTMASCPSKLYHADGHTNDLLLGRSSTHTVLYTTCKAEAKVMDIVEGK